MAAVGILLIMGLIAMLEIPSMLRKKWKRELWTFIILMILATGLAVAQTLKIKLPNPLDFIALIYKPISDWMLQLLK